MSRLLKPLITALAILTLVPTTASARPQDCDEACSCTSSCDQLCTMPGGSIITTCGDWGVCTGGCFSKTSETLSAEEDGQDTKSAESVCREPQQEA